MRQNVLMSECQERVGKNTPTEFLAASRYKKSKHHLGRHCSHIKEGSVPQTHSYTLMVTPSLNNGFGSMCEQIMEWRNKFWIIIIGTMRTERKENNNNRKQWSFLEITSSKKKTKNYELQTVDARWDEIWARLACDFQSKHNIAGRMRVESFWFVNMASHYSVTLVIAV